MSVDLKTEQVFRRFEQEVLDKHHKTFSLWTRDRSTAIYAALAQLDCFAILSLFGPAVPSGIGPLQILKNLEEGLSEALRWLHDGTQEIDLTPTENKQILEEAGDFCQFAGKYVDIADFHKMYGRGQVEIEVNELAKSVRFVTPKDGTPAVSLFARAELSHRLNKLPIIANPASKADLQQKIINLLGGIQFRYESGHIALPNISVVNDENLKAMFDWAMPKEPLPLDKNEDLVGFTVGEFEKFYATLRRWSYCCTSGFLLSIMQRGKHQWQCAPTQHMERSEFINSFRTLTDLSETTLNAIVRRLTYDRSTPWPDVYLQPLFCGDSTVTWSTSVVQNSRQLRNMLKLMSRTKTLQNRASTLIGSRENQMLRELGNLFARRGGTSYKLMTSISCGEAHGEVDLLAYNLKFPEELLIIEGKALLGVDEINEVEAATNEMQGGQTQLSNAKSILDRMSDAEKESIFKFVKWPLVRNVFGVVVSADAEPNDKYDHSVYPGISLQTLEARLRENHFASPQKFWRACKDRRWMDKLRAYTVSHKPICIGEVTYELPILIEPQDIASATSIG